MNLQNLFFGLQNDSWFEKCKLVNMLYSSRVLASTLKYFGPYSSIFSLGSDKILLLECHPSPWNNKMAKFPNSALMKDLVVNFASY